MSEEPFLIKYLLQENETCFILLMLSIALNMSLFFLIGYLKGTRDK